MNIYFVRFVNINYEQKLILYNKKIIQKREGEREERAIPAIRLWGIWKQYEKSDEPEEVENENISFLD